MEEKKRKCSYPIFFYLKESQSNSHPILVPQQAPSDVGGAERALWLAQSGPAGFMWRSEQSDLVL